MLCKFDKCFFRISLSNKNYFSLFYFCIKYNLQESKEKASLTISSFDSQKLSKDCHQMHELLKAYLWQLIQNYQVKNEFYYESETLQCLTNLCLLVYRPEEHLQMLRFRTTNVLLICESPCLRV